MPYSQFTTISKAKAAFGLQVQETRFLPPVAAIASSSNWQEFLGAISTDRFGGQ